MKRNDCVVVTGAAAVTAALTLALFTPGQLIATGNDEETLRPVLSVSGCELTLSALPQRIEQGLCPALTLEAVNTSDQRQEFVAEVVMTTTEAAAQFSRRMVIPTEYWKCPYPIALDPGERAQFEVQADGELPPGTMVSFLIRSGEQAITATGTVVAGGDGANNLLLVPAPQVQPDMEQQAPDQQGPDPVAQEEVLATVALANGE